MTTLSSRRSRLHPAGEVGWSRSPADAPRGLPQAHPRRLSGAFAVAGERGVEVGAFGDGQTWCEVGTFDTVCGRGGVDLQLRRRHGKGLPGELLTHGGDLLAAAANPGAPDRAG